MEHLSFSDQLTAECLDPAIERAIAEAKMLSGLVNSGVPGIKCCLSHLDRAVKMEAETMEEKNYKLNGIRAEIVWILSLAKSERVGSYSTHPFLNGHEKNGKVHKK